MRFCGFGKREALDVLDRYDPLADQIKKLFCASFEIFPFLKPPSVAIQIAAAPSVRGELLSAVRVPCPLVRSNTGFNLASFSVDVSRRGKWSLDIPSKGTIKSVKKPRSWAGWQPDDF